MKGIELRSELPPDFEIHWYKIQSVLGKGGYGVTYLAEDTNLKKQVAIKEYFPRDYAAREQGYTVHPVTGEYRGMYKWGLDRFLKEARTLAKFHHPNIVRVLSVFELNNTAYMVMEYEQGEDLSKVYKQGKLSQQQILDIFLPVIDGLKRVHEAGFIHRDVKPSNIYIRKDGSPVLLDFGSARQSSGSTTVTLTSLVTYGFAPYEQYADSDEKQGPWTDIYALGACLYLAVTGKLPKEAMARGTEIISHNKDPLERCSELAKGEYSQAFLFAIDKALSFQITERPQTLEEWRRLLTLDDTDLGDTVKIDQPFSDSIFQKPTVITAAEPTPFDIRQYLPWLGGAAALLLLVSLYFIFGGDSEEASPTAMLLSQAQTARDSGRLMEPKGESALDLYNKVLNLDPHNQAAKKGRQDILDKILAQVRQSMTAGKLQQAVQQINQVYIAAPNEIRVVQVKQELEDLIQQGSRREEINKLLQLATKYMDSGSLVGEDQDNAHETYRRVLLLDPGNLQAQTGIDKIVNHYFSAAELRLKKGDRRQVQKYLDILLDIAPEAEQTAALQRKLQEKQQAKRDEVPRLLQQAKRAMNRGWLTRPKSRNAIFYYRKVLSLQPANRQAKQGINLISQKLIREFNQAKDARNFKKAKSLVKTYDRAFPKSRLTSRMQAELDKVANQPDFEAISGVLARYKRVFEAKDSRLLFSMSESRPERDMFVKSLFQQYRSFRIKITDLQHINKQRRAVAKVKIDQLVNIDGAHVSPGSWSQFDIEIKRNRRGEWRVKW